MQVEQNLTPQVFSQTAIGASVQGSPALLTRQALTTFLAEQFSRPGQFVALASAMYEAHIKGTYALMPQDEEAPPKVHLVKLSHTDFRVDVASDSNMYLRTRVTVVLSGKPRGHRRIQAAFSPVEVLLPFRISGGGSAGALVSGEFQYVIELQARLDDLPKFKASLTRQCELEQACVQHEAQIQAQALEALRATSSFARVEAAVAEAQARMEASRKALEAVVQMRESLKKSELDRARGSSPFSFQAELDALQAELPVTHFWGSWR